VKVQCWQQSDGVPSIASNGTMFFTGKSAL